jgi:hypothetical protein
MLVASLSSRFLRRPVNISVTANETSACDQITARDSRDQSFFS